ncbi:MAG: PQQ-binding-like beta-propeller repeat protein [bacterium]
MSSKGKTRKIFGEGFSLTTRYSLLAAFTIFLFFSCRADAAVSLTKRPGVVDYDSLMLVVASSDNFRWSHRVPGNLAGYNENDYSEFNNFGFALGSPPTSVSVEGEWRYVGEQPDGVKLEVWEQETSTWHDETGITITTADSTWSRTVTAYINTALDVNNIKVRLVAYEGTSIASDVEIDGIRVNVDAGAIIRYPGGGLSTSVIAIQSSDDVWLPWLANIPQNAFDETKYQEYTNAGFTMPAGSIMGSVQVTYEWQWNRLAAGANISAAKLEVWEADNPGWNIHNETLVVPTYGVDSSETKQVASYIDTANDINNLKLRFLAYKVGTPTIGTRPDYISITAKRKIVASDVPVYGPGAATYYAGETDKLVLDFKIPDDDGAADTLNTLYVTNAGTATNTTDIASLKLYTDTGAVGWQGPPTDTQIGVFTWNAVAGRWEVSPAVGIPIGGLRLFVAANIASNPTDARTIQMQIPVNAITVASTYGGPTDAAITNPYTQTIDGMIAAQITNTGAPAVSFYAGATNQLVMDFTIPLNGATADTLTGLRVKNSGTALNSTDISAVNAWAENGVTAGFQAAEDTSLGALTWSAANSWWAKTDILLAYSSAQRLYITVDIASNPTDGSTAQIYLPQGGTDADAGVVVASGNDGPLDAVITNPNVQTVDGMIAAQITNTGAAAATFYANDTNKLVMNFLLPANGTTADTLTGLRVQNTGTAVNGTDIAAVKFWEDRDDNGIFAPAGADAPALATATWNAGGWWEALLLSTAIPSGGQRFFVSTDIAATHTALSTIQMALKQGSADVDAGVVVASGNDGPLDAVITNPNVQTIKKRLDVSGIDKAPAYVNIGSTNNTMLQLQCTASNGTIQISTVQADLSGTALDTDIAAAKLWHDVNNDGAWDAGDAQLSTTKTFTAGTLTFDAAAFNVVSGTPESVIITYDIAVAAVPGRTAGVSLANSTYVTVSAPGSDDVAFAAEPTASSNSLIGTTLTVTGYDKAPAEVFPNETDRVMEQLKLESSGGVITVTSVKAELSGSGTSSDISAAKLYDDVNDNGTYEGGTDVLLDTKTFAGSPASATFIISYNVTAGTPEYLLIAYDIAGGAAAGNTVGASIPSTTYVTTSGGENIYFANTIQSSNSSIGQALSVSGADKAPATVQVGETDVEMLWLTLTASSGAITLTDLKIDRTGTGADADIASAKLYDDVNDDGVLDIGDALLSTKTFIGATLTFNALIYTITSPTAEHLLVVFNIASSATTGNTVGARIVDKTYVTVTAPPTVSPFSTINSGTPQITNTLTVSGTDRAAALTDVTKGQTNVVFEQLTMSSAAGTINVATVKIDLTGTGVDTDVATAALYHDVNDNGAYDGGTDVQLGADKTFTAGTLTFDGFTFPVVNGATESLIVLYTISGAATQGSTVGVSLANSTYVTTSPSSGVTVNFTVSPINSTNLEIKNAASLTASFQTITSPVNTNQTFSVTFSVTNAVGSSQANNVSPSPTDLTKYYIGGALVTKISGPTPASANIAGGGLQNFAYQFRADAAGTVQFEGTATGTESNLGTPVSSNTPTSNVVTINLQVSPVWEFSDSGTTLAFNEGGQMEWDCPAGAPVNTYYIGNSNGKFYAINMSDGTKRWAYTALAAINSLPKVNYETCNIYFGDDSGNFYAIHDDGASASNVWGPLSLSPASAIKAAPILDIVGTETRVYVPSTNGTFYCRLADTGGACTGWTDTAMGAAVSSSPALSADNYFWVPTEGGAIQKVDKTNGNIVVTFIGYGVFNSSPFTFPRDLLDYSLGNWMFIGDNNRKFYRLDTWQLAGSEIAWTFSPSSPVQVLEFKTGAWFNKGFVQVGNESVYAGNDNGCIYSLNYTNGTQKWMYPDGTSCLTYPVTSRTLFYNNIVYFGTSNGSFYALQDNVTSASVLTGWPYVAAGAIKAVSVDAYGTNRVMAISADGKVYAFPLQ